MTQSEFIGVDGCRCGWFSVGFDQRGSYEMQTFTTFRELLTHYRKAELVLVDIPIGLPEDCKGRRCDDKARGKLGSRASSVFRTPTRQTVEQAVVQPRDYWDAANVERRVAKRGISRQAFAITPKIHEVDKVMLARGEGAKPLVREVHPELCFWALNGRQSIEWGKKKREGTAERLRVLQCIEPRAEEIFDESISCFRRKDVAKDDILDALAAAVTAYASQGKLQTIPEVPPKDPRGLPMEMVYFPYNHTGR